MSFTQTFLVQCLLFIPLPYVLFAALKSRRVMPLAVLQVLVGVVMGPSLFGRLYPEFFAEIFRPDMVAPLRGIALIAVLLFAFITGLHLDLTRLRGRASALGMVAGASLVVPFVAGLGCGIWIVGRDDLASAHPLVFIFAIGICTSVTAMPVLGAILREMDLLSHHLGQLALSLAAMNDAALWVMLTLLLAVLGAPGSAPALLLLLPVYLGVMFWIAPRLLDRVAARLTTRDGLSNSGLAIVGGVAVASALVAQLIGLEYILGAFIAGVAMPVALRRATLDRIEIVTMTLLMPFFFTLTGLQTFIDLASPDFLAIFLVTTSLAVGAKILGTAIAARAVGEPWPIAIGLGSLMQTKGLMEVVILTIFRENGLISAQIFSALILMSLVCTALTMPLTNLALGRRAAAGAADDTAHGVSLPQDYSGFDRGRRGDQISE
jgi:Kef-type K+ transport system membrane component KefB